MLDFFTIYWPDVLILVAIVGALLYFYKAGKKDLVKKIILSLVVQAEKTLGSGTGELKYAMVVERAYEVMPTILKLLITKKELDNLIEEAVQYMKNYLAQGKSLRGYDEEFIEKKIS